MNAVLESLLKLQAIDFAETKPKAAAAQAVELRTQVPAPILGHYDRLASRGKKGVALVRNHTCTGCYMRQPIGKITTLMRGDDIQLCDSCGRYLYLPAEPEAATAAEPALVAKAKTPRRRTAKSAAASAPETAAAPVPTAAATA